MNLATLTERLDAELRTDDFDDIDGSPNGLQVGASADSVASAAVAVDAAESTIQEAIGREVDVLIAHHGLWWENIERVTGPTYRRLRALMDHDISLYVSHLPLDAHQEIGNAAVIAADLALNEREPFGQLGDEVVGQMGVLASPLPIGDVVDAVQAALPGSDRPQVLPHGPETVERIGIVTGSGVDWVDEAASRDVDVLLTGEGKHSAYHRSKELGVTLVLGGHYATETGGVKEIARLLEEWDIETTFIDEPSGL